jgi:hypothetical protein
MVSVLGGREQAQRVALSDEVDHIPYVKERATGSGRDLHLKRRAGASVEADQEDMK